MSERAPAIPDVPPHRRGTPRPSDSTPRAADRTPRISQVWEGLDSKPWGLGQVTGSKVQRVGPKLWCFVTMYLPRPENRRLRPKVTAVATGKSRFKIWVSRAPARESSFSECCSGSGRSRNKAASSHSVRSPGQAGRPRPLTPAFQGTSPPGSSACHGGTGLGLGKERL